MDDTALLDARSFHSHLACLLGAELASLGDFLQALAEFDRRALFRDLGHASLFDYLHARLKLSRGAAHYRRTAASLVRRFPEILEPIRDGRLCFSTVAVVASVLTEANRAEVLPRFFGLSKLEALEVAAELKPRPVVPSRTVVTQVEPAIRTAPGAGPRDETREGTRAMPGDEGVDALVGQAPAWTRPDQKVHLGELRAPGSDSGRTAVEPMTATMSRLHITVSREFLTLLRMARTGQSHVQPGATDEQVLTAALEALLEKQAKRRACVPPRVKREVVKRDQGRCQWPLDGGGICGATSQVQVDHVRPRGRGGPDTVDNCRVLCRAHNLEAARRDYGDKLMGRFMNVE